RRPAGCGWRADDGCGLVRDAGAGDLGTGAADGRRAGHPAVLGVALAPYRSAGVRLTLGDIPPFMWVPAIAMPAASVLGWVDRVRG
ncbi:MAG: hypothetical protein R3246_12285, partial [Acidimicrobiia bacterium]|nr:hypothetical protein [Acidimicrobiia bacterium]